MNLEVNQSTDYSKFKFLELNRKVNQKHVDNLIRLNEERSRYHLFPIVVDEQMNIIDGQHRYTACKKSNKPIYYLKDDRSSHDKFKEITKVNTATRTHGHAEIFDMLIQKGDRTATQIKAFKTLLKENHDITVDIFTLIRLCTISENKGAKYNWPSGSTSKNAMQEQKFKLAEDAEYRVHLLIKINEACGFGGGNIFNVCKAVYVNFKKNKVDFEAGIKKLADSGFAKGQSLKGLTYKQTSIEVVRKYNKWLSQKKKIAE